MRRHDGFGYLLMNLICPPSRQARLGLVHRASTVLLRPKHPLVERQAAVAVAANVADEELMKPCRRGSQLDRILTERGFLDCLIDLGRFRLLTELFEPVETLSAVLRLVAYSVVAAQLLRPLLRAWFRVIGRTPLGRPKGAVLRPGRELHTHARTGGIP